MTDPERDQTDSSGSSVSLRERLLVACFRAPVIFLVTVLLGTASVAGSVFDRRGRFQHWCARTWGRMVLLVGGVRLRVDGLEGLGRQGRYVLCANHQSDMDIPVLLAALPFQFRFAAKKSLFRVPFLGWHLRRAGHVPIDRDNPRAAVRALEDSVAWVREGVPVVLFPEGRISQSGVLGTFKRGAFVLAERTEADIVPVAIRGTRAVMRPSSWLLRSGPVEVTIGPVLPSKSLSVRDMMAAVRRFIVNQVDDSGQLRRPSDESAHGID